jgi:hypothetical protein
MRKKMNVRKLFRITAFVRFRRSLCLHENRLWLRENGPIGLRNGRMNSKLIARTLRQWRPNQRPGFRR